MSVEQPGAPVTGWRRGVVASVVGVTGVAAVLVTLVVIGDMYRISSQVSSNQSRLRPRCRHRCNDARCASRSAGGPPRNLKSKLA